MVGNTISHYQILEKLGEGGMGRVYRAMDTRLGRTVAIKVVSAGLTQRFHREAKAVSALNHPHICALYDIGEHEGAPYLVMEYVEGKPLKGPLPAEPALAYAIQVSNALVAAHKAGIIHRDLKPDNILLTREGGVKILDFGLAKLETRSNADTPTVTMTQQGAVTGTGPYMSPEQARGEPVDARSDIFSFGVVFYELLTGWRVFHRDTIGATLGAVIGTEPPPLREAPPAIARIVSRMLEKKREDRYQSAEELLVDLMMAAQPDSRIAWRLLRLVRHPRWLLAGTAVLLLLVAGFITARNRRLAGTDARWGDGAAAALTPAEAFQRAQAYLQRYDRKGNTDRAIAVLEPASLRDAQNATLHAALAEAYVRKYSETSDKQWLNRAADSGRKAVAANDDLAAGHASLGMALAAGGQRSDAAHQFERARDLNPLSGPAHLGLAQLRPGQEAEQLHRKAIQYSPADWRPLDALATFFYRAARYDESIGTWRQALDLTPDNVVVMVRLAAGFHMKGQYAEAANILQSALALDATTASTWANLGTARYFQGRYQDAVRAFEKSVELSPDRYMYWGNLGDSFRWAEGLKDKAGPAYRNAIRLTRERLAVAPNDRLRSSLAVYLAKSGDRAGALAEVAQLAQVQQSDQGTLFKMALVYELTGDRTKALSTLGRAIRAGYSMHEIVNEPELVALRLDARYRQLASSAPSGKKK